MDDVDRFPIYSVAVDPEYCPQCGTTVETQQFDAVPLYRCPEREMVVARNPLAAVHVIVWDGDEILLLDEPVPHHEGVWSLPGGHASYDEAPREAVVREPHEDTGLRADPADLSLLTVYHAESSRMAFHFTTYTLDQAATTGEMVPETEGFEIEVLPVENVHESYEGDDDRSRNMFHRSAGGGLRSRRTSLLHTRVVFSRLLRLCYKQRDTAEPDVSVLPLSVEPTCVVRRLSVPVRVFGS